MEEFEKNLVEMTEEQEEKIRKEFSRKYSKWVIVQVVEVIGLIMSVLIGIKFNYRIELIIVCSCLLVFVFTEIVGGFILGMSMCPFCGELLRRRLDSGCHCQYCGKRYLE